MQASCFLRVECRLMGYTNILNKAMISLVLKIRSRLNILIICVNAMCSVCQNHVAVE